VRAFLAKPIGSLFGKVESNLAKKLTADNVATWLRLCSMHGWDELVKTCVDIMLSHNVSIDNALLSRLQPKHADALLGAVRDKLTDCSTDMMYLRSRLRALEDAASDADELRANMRKAACVDAQGQKCQNCKFARYVKPSGVLANWCMNCGCQF